MTALYNTPFNPVREKYDEQIHSYMSPYFGQDWHLFAPEPVAEDSGILVRAQKVRADGSLVTTKWADVTTPHISKLQQQRFWPSRVQRLPTGVRQQLDSWRDPQLEELRAKNLLPDPRPDSPESKKHKKLNPPLTPAEHDARATALRYAQALASAEATQLWGNDIRSIQVRVVSNEFPRFSERYTRDSKGKISYYDLDWMKPLKVTG
ncbi:DUF5819 family protein [Streptomyces apocyni]|uniref:DUF5819 family protein n=1 Tax=Streptomyces apocyni TaxID=2654677 RepID=UPI0012EAFD5A|nr:DUF5819 family protein [Streptomyces apocyni]